MPNSRARRKRRPRQTVHDQLLKAEERARRTPATRAGRLKKRLGWPLCAFGVLLFIAGYIGAQTGNDLVPFDQHHLISQMGGGFLALTGLIWVTR